MMASAVAGGGGEWRLGSHGVEEEVPGGCGPGEWVFVGERENLRFRGWVGGFSWEGWVARAASVDPTLKVWAALV